MPEHTPKKTGFIPDTSGWGLHFAKRYCPACGGVAVREERGYRIALAVMGISSAAGFLVFLEGISLWLKLLVAAAFAASYGTFIFYLAKPVKPFTCTACGHVEQYQEPKS